MDQDYSVGFEERKKHGDLLFPFSHYRTVIPEFLHSFPPHWHEEIEIIVAMEGQCHYLIYNETLTVNKGDILVIFPSNIHSFIQKESYHFYGDTFLFHLNFINNNIDICSGKYFSKILGNQCNPYLLIRPDLPQYASYYTIVQTLFQAYLKKEDFFELEIKYHLTSLVLHLFKDGLLKLGSKDSSQNISKIRDIIKFIETNYQNEISLEQLATTFHISVSHMAHIFKDATGMSVIEYIISYRLSTAANLLRTTSQSILTIALDTGFNNVSYFNRSFKSKYNMTPKEYRGKTD